MKVLRPSYDSARFDQKLSWIISLETVNLLCYLGWSDGYQFDQIEVIHNLAVRPGYDSTRFDEKLRSLVWSNQGEP